MVAGRSAMVEAQRQLSLADDYDERARVARQMAANFEAGAAGERMAAPVLGSLVELGWRVLSDRRWGRRANIDFVLVGPAGVVIVDVKKWRDLVVSERSIFRGDACADDELDKMDRMAEDVCDVLAELGITPASVIPALVFLNQAIRQDVNGVHLLALRDVPVWLTRRARRFDAEVVDQVAALLDAAFPPHDGSNVAPTPAKRRRVLPRLTSGPPQSESEARHEADEPVLFDVDELADAVLNQALAGSIEDWMTFLHPGQLKLVTARHRGAARVRGSAGTGKTVVGLHRAAHLAKGAPGTIYFVTFVRTLPQVLRSLVTRLAPEAVERIRFTGLHQLARHVLTEAGASTHVDLAKVETAFAKAWIVRGRGTLLEALDTRPAYWKEEIDYVIKGRDLTEFEEYADLRRAGRGTRMARSHREVMWDVFVEYQHNLDLAGTLDFNDLLILARDIVRSGEVETGCSGVIVDEVQDLTMVGLQFLHVMAGEGEDRFLVIGDGQQSIYPGGFTLAEAGIDVRGRAAVLELNYRNTGEILTAAQRVIEGQTFDDLEGETQNSDSVVPVRRAGEPPVIVEAAGRPAMLEAVLRQVQALVAGGVATGDVGVLLLRSKDVAVYRDHLQRAGIGAIALEQYQGATTDAVKVGTVKRAKGLEFAQVLLPELVPGDPAPWAGESDDAHVERVARHRRELFVAMTRARDGLWIGHLVAAGPGHSPR